MSLGTVHFISSLLEEMNSKFKDLQLLLSCFFYLYFYWLVIVPILCVLLLVEKKISKSFFCVLGLSTHLKRAVAKDRSEEGSGHHGEDG